MSGVQPCESGERILEEISFNRSDSIVVQRSAENERIIIEGLSENENISFNLHSSSLTVRQVERDFGKHSIQWMKSRYCADVYRSEI